MTIIRGSMNMMKGSRLLLSSARTSGAGVLRPRRVVGSNISSSSNSSHHHNNNTIRLYSSTRSTLFADDGGGGEDKVTEADAEVDAEAIAAAAAAQAVAEQKLLKRTASLEYNNKRAAYNRSVGKLRSNYKEEHLKHAAQDIAERDAQLLVVTRRRLERQRAKNERSFQNAIRQEELKRQTAAAFQDHLKVQQEIRVEKEALHQRARQLLVDDLEEESKLWMTTVEEVEAAFSSSSSENADEDETEQLLWARPQGVLGVKNPSMDSHFWHTYEGHTWDRSKTYKTKSQLLLEQLEHEAYVDTNVDFVKVWTKDKVQERERLEQKAQLRATVRQAGRKALLQRQKDYLAVEHEPVEGEAPKPMPIPSLGVLGNIKAQEKEGSELLLKDPTKFFVFDTTTNDDNDNIGNNNNGGDDASYAGSSLGVPVALRDPLRTGQPQGRVFPIPVGKLPKPDLRSEKEKKRQEREERLWAAAGKASEGGEDNDDDLLIAEEDRVIGEAIDYEEANANWDSDDEDWKKGLDEDLEKDKAILNVPREFRYRDDDIDQVIVQLEAKAKTMQSHVQNTIKTMEQEARSRIERVEEDGAISDAISSDNVEGVATAQKDDGDDSAAAPFFDQATTEQLSNVGADVDKYERLMASLTQEQLLSMFGLEAQERETTSADGDDAVDESSDAAAAAAATTGVFEGIPGLSEQQIVELTELESFIRIAEKSAATTTTTDDDSVVV